MNRHQAYRMNQKLAADELIRKNLSSRWELPSVGDEVSVRISTGYSQVRTSGTVTEVFPKVGSFEMQSAIGKVVVQMGRLSGPDQRGLKRKAS